jgi:hypothetical protein
MSVWNITGTALRFITLHYFFQENAYAYKIHGQIRVQYIVQALTSQKGCDATGNQQARTASKQQ